MTNNYDRAKMILHHWHGPSNVQRSYSRKLENEESTIMTGAYYPIEGGYLAR